MANGKNNGSKRHAAAVDQLKRAARAYAKTEKALRGDGHMEVAVAVWTEAREALALAALDYAGIELTAERSDG